MRSNSENDGELVGGEKMIVRKRPKEVISYNMSRIRSEGTKL